MTILTTVLLLIIALIIAILAVMYTTRQQKKLSDENLIDFERNIKPKMIKLVLLTTIPTLSFFLHVVITQGDMKVAFIALYTVLFTAISTAAYYRAKTIIKHSGKQKEYNYISNYIFFFSFMQLLLMIALTNVFIAYINR